MRAQSAPTGCKASAGRDPAASRDVTAAPACSPSPPAPSAAVIRVEAAGEKGKITSTGAIVENTRGPVTGIHGTAIDIVGGASRRFAVNHGASLFGTVSADGTGATPDLAGDPSRTGGNSVTPTGPGHHTNLVDFDKTGDGARELAVSMLHGQQGNHVTRNPFVAPTGEASRCKFYGNEIQLGGSA